MSRFAPMAVLAMVSIVVPPTSGTAQNVTFGSDSMVIAVPIVFAAVQKTGLAGINTKFDIDVRMTNGVVEVRDPESNMWRTDWRSAAFPPKGRYQIANVKQVKRPNNNTNGKALEVTLHIAPTYDYRIYAPTDQPNALNAVLVPKSREDSVLTLSYAALAPKVFVGPLAAFSREEQMILMRFAHQTAGAKTLGSEQFKNITYLTIAIPEEGSVWNNLKVSKTERVGRLISDQLQLLKTFAKMTVNNTAFGGLKFTAISRHGTAPNYFDIQSDTVEAYFPLEAMLKFKDADITSQQLVNQSIILVNGDRVEVDLSVQ